MKMGFKVSENSVKKNIIFPKDFTNGIVFGRTGSGKTSCAILPNIEDRIESDYGLLIYDFKGNLHLQTKYLAQKYNKLSDVIEIGKPWGKNINLFDYLSLAQIPMIVKTEDNKNDYWDSASRNLLENIYIVYKNFYLLEKELNKANMNFKLIHTLKEPSYSNIYSCISSVVALSNFYKNMTTNLEYIESNIPFCNNKQINKRKNIINNLIFNIKKSMNSLNLYEVVNKDDDTGKNAVVNHLNSILSVIATKEYLNRSEIDIIKELRAGKIVVIDVSNFNENILNAINIAIYSRLQKAIYEMMKPVSIIIDEAQKVLNSDYLPQTDICREAKFEYLFATQDPVLLINKLGQNNFDELYSNLISKYSLATNTNDDLQQFEFIDLSNQRKAHANPLFIDRKDLITIEHQFLKQNNLLKLVDYKSKDPFIFIHDSKLLEDYKIMIETIKGKFITVDYLSIYKVIVEEEIETDYITIVNGMKKIVPQDKIAELEEHINNCLRSVGAIIKENNKMSQKVASLENTISNLNSNSSNIGNNICIEEIFGSRY